MGVDFRIFFFLFFFNNGNIVGKVLDTRHRVLGNISVQYSSSIRLYPCKFRGKNLISGLGSDAILR